MNTKTPRANSFLFLVVGLIVVAGLCACGTALPPAQQMTQESCPLPDGVAPVPDPSVTARQVEDGSATLAEFTLVARDYSRNRTGASLERAAYLSCIGRQDDGIWRSGSIYFVTLTAEGRVFYHSKDMALSGRLLKPAIYGTILLELGVSPADLTNLASPDPATAAQAMNAVIDTLTQEPDAPFDATTPVPGVRPGIPAASGHAAVFVSLAFRAPMLMVAGFDLSESHLVPISEEDIDYGDPAVTAQDVVDRETLKAFVAEAWDYIVENYETHGAAYAGKQKLAFRDPNGPWRHGSVYLYILDRVSNIILFHGGFPSRHEGLPLVPVARDAVTGELILPQVLAAAERNPEEGGFVEYYFDDPDDDTDRADIPKVGYARQFTGELRLADGRVITTRLVIGSGFYPTSSE